MKRARTSLSARSKWCWWTVLRSAYGPWVDSFLKAALPQASKLPRLCINTIEKGPAATRRSKNWGWRSRLHQGRDRRPNIPSSRYTIDRWLHNEETIDLGDDHSLKVLQTPGHTPDSLCLWYERDQILFTGATITSSEGGRHRGPAPSATLLQSTYRGRLGKKQTHQRKAASIQSRRPRRRSRSGAHCGAQRRYYGPLRRSFWMNCRRPQKTAKYRDGAATTGPLVASTRALHPAKISSVDAVLEAWRGRRGGPLEIVAGDVRPARRGGEGGTAVRVF